VDSDHTSIVFVSLGELSSNVVSQIIDVALHHLTHGDFISDVVKHIWELGVFDDVILLKSDQQIFLLWSQGLGSSDYILEMLDRDQSIFNGVHCFELKAQQLVAFFNFCPEDKLERFLVMMIHL
jgi:hypothetical protein